MIQLDIDETLQKVVRKHWLLFVLQILGFVILLLLPYVILVVVDAFFPIFDAPTVQHILWYLYIIYAIILWIAGFISWTNYYLDMWLITSDRIIDIEQRSLFSRETSSMRVDHIQDIKIEVSGLLDTLLGIGTIYVQSAGAEREFVIRHAARPQKIKRIIMDMQDAQREVARNVKIVS